MKFEKYADRDMLVINVANLLAVELDSCLMEHPFASFAVPGGTTPGPIFDLLCATDLDWSRVHVMLTDERWVPEDDARSNARLVRERLMVDHAARALFLPFYRSGKTVEAAAPELSETLTPEMPISVLLLGMGEDMHTASLFPGAEGLKAALAKGAPIACAVRPEDQPEARMTLSAPALDGAMSKHLVIFGDAKRKAFENAMHLTATEAPIRAVIDEGTVHWAA